MTYPAPLQPFKPRPVPPLFPAYSLPAPDLSLFEKQIQQLARQLSRPYHPTFPIPTTKEEPTMTRHLIHKDAQGDTLYVNRTTDRGNPVAEIDFENEGRTVYVDKEAAPRVALAILEASGLQSRGDGSASVAIRALKSHLHRVALKAQQERLEAEKLDKEALALLNAATRENYVSLSSAGTIADFWRRAATKARELHAPADNN